MPIKGATKIRNKLMKIVGTDALEEQAPRAGTYASSLHPVSVENTLCMVRPKNTEEVQRIVQLANEMTFNVVPVSSGPPHVHGATVPAAPGIIMDLSSMQTIRRVDRRNKVAIIEPGVTFPDLKAAAEGEGLKVLMPLLPRASKSVIASYLEREPITIPKYHWDMTDPMLCTELVFGTGDFFRTGSAAGPGSLEEQWAKGGAQKNPLGPAQTDFMRLLQGAQGSMGVVTWASVKLERTPKMRRLYSVSDSRLERLIELSYAMLRRRLADEFILLNHSSLASIFANDLGKENLSTKTLPDFTLLYCLSGYDEYPEQRIAYQETDIARIAQSCAQKPRRGVGEMSGQRALEVIDNPSPEPYWKQRMKGAYLEIFFLTTLDRVPTFFGEIFDLMAGHDKPSSELGIYIQPIQQGRSCHVEFDLFYDPSDRAEIQRAENVFREASNRFADLGAFFSRPYGSWSEIAYARCPDTVQALKMVKGIVDPQGVFNHGRICF